LENGVKYYRTDETKMKENEDNIENKGKYTKVLTEDIRKKVKCIKSV
jgi:hypothetical protein